jgi:hypothetical protein
MADSEQVLQGKMAITRAGRAFGADTPITPRTGDKDKGGETPLSEYSLHFKMVLLPGISGQAVHDS